jgi:hypothetical protein
VVGGGDIVTVTSAVPATATHATTVIISTAKATATAAMAAGATVVTGPNGGSIYTREEGVAGIGGVDTAIALIRRAGPDPDDPTAAWGTELWLEWTGWIVLGSILPSVIAYVVS